MNIQKIRNTLLYPALALIAIDVLIVILGETECVESLFPDFSEQTEFLLTCTMECVTLLFIPLALRLFKFDFVARQIAAAPEKGMVRWGLIRLAAILVPLTIDVVLYYCTMNTSYGYLAIIHLVALAFVFPTSRRCEAETENNHQSE